MDSVWEGWLGGGKGMSDVVRGPNDVSLNACEMNV